MKKWLAFQISVFGVCLNLLEMTALWLFIWRCDGNFDVVTLQRRHSEGDMNNW
jgi:hypothetical protein